MMEEQKPKPVVWMGSSKEDLKEFPDDVQGEFGHALWVAQQGDKYVSAKPLKGFGGASALEIVEDYDGDTYRAVYTVRFAEAVFVLHSYVIQKEIEKRNITQAEAGKIMGIDQSDVSRLLKGRLRTFSIERLFQFLNRLGYNVELKIIQERSRKRQAHTYVNAA